MKQGQCTNPRLTLSQFHGDTQNVEKHLSAESNAGSVSVGWGPFSVSSSFHQSSSRESFQMQSTAIGCAASRAAGQDKSSRDDETSVRTEQKLKTNKRPVDLHTRAGLRKK